MWQRKHDEWRKREEQVICANVTKETWQMKQRKTFITINTFSSGKIKWKIKTLPKRHLRDMVLVCPYLPWPATTLVSPTHLVTLSLAAQKDPVTHFYIWVAGSPAGFRLLALTMKDAVHQASTILRLTTTFFYYNEVTISECVIWRRNQ